MAIETVTPLVAYESLSGGSEALLVDVRTAEEFGLGHPEGALNVPWALMAPGGGMAPNPDFLPAMRKLCEPETKLYVSCQAGVRSLKACHDLEQAGFSDLVNVDGGFGGRRDPAGTLLVTGWAESGLPVASGPSA